MSTLQYLKNVTPIGFPGYGGAHATDIAVKDGAVAAVGVDDAERLDGYEVADFGGAYVSPAWIDMHTHVYWGGSDIAVWPSDVGIRTGVPILVDAGSAGEGHFNGFYEFHMKRAVEMLIPFLNIGSVGLVATNRVPEVRLMRDVDVAKIMETVERYHGLIRGLKVRLCTIIESENDLMPLKIAKKLSRVLKLPVMVHIGLSLPLVEEVLDRLDAGDILTHCFQGKPASSIVDDEVAFAAAERAKRRGVLFDIGHGSASFAYRVGRIAVERGLLPDTFGSDVYKGNVNGPVWDLSIVLAKMLAIGLSLDQVIEGVAITPRRALGLPGMALVPGSEAAYTVFTIEDADINLPDSMGDEMRIQRRFIPKAVLWKGALTRATSRYDDER